jgi:hypothetical protein
MFEGIVEIWEIDTERDVNTLLKLGWKILQIVQKVRSKTEAGFIHSKFVGVGSEIVYVMGRTEKVSPRKDRYEFIDQYQERLEGTIEQ